MASIMSVYYVTDTQYYKCIIFSAFPFYTVLICSLQKGKPRLREIELKL